MTPPNPAPRPLNRPKLARWLWERDLDNQAAADRLGRSREWMRLVLLPFDDSRRRIPDREAMEAIHILTEGEVGPADFYQIVEGPALKVAP